MARDQREVGAALLEVARHADVPSEPLRDAGLIDAIPELTALGETPQDARWHPEGDVLVHSLWSADLAASHALEHDVEADRRELLVHGLALPRRRQAADHAADERADLVARARRARR